MVVTFVVIMITSAGIFKEVACGTLLHVDVELDRLGCLTLAVLEHQDDGNKVALGQLLFRKKAMLGFLKSEFRRLGALASDRLYRRGIIGQRLPFVIKESNLNQTLLGNKKFSVRNDVMQNAATIGSLDLMIMVFGMLISGLVIVLLFISEGERNEEGWNQVS